MFNRKIFEKGKGTAFIRINIVHISHVYMLYPVLIPVPKGIKVEATINVKQVFYSDWDVCCNISSLALS